MTDFNRVFGTLAILVLLWGCNHSFIIGIEVPLLDVMASITVQEPSKTLHCEHYYHANRWKCMKCGYQIPPELSGDEGSCETAS